MYANDIRNKSAAFHIYADLCESKLVKKFKNLFYLF